MATKKILVTGGAGFIGSEFVRQGVQRGYDIVVIDKLTYAGDLERLKEVDGEYKFYKIDIADKESIFDVFQKESPDAVVHFAAESHVDRSILDPTPFFKTNVIGTLNLLEAAREFGVERFINISTDEVYGELGDEGNFTEESPLKPNSPYSTSKAAQDMLGRAYYRTYSVPVITVRPSNNYGPWQYPEKLIPVVIMRALNNESIPVYGTGKNVREWLHVSDCVNAIFLILDKGSIGEIYNVGSGNEKRNIEIVNDICQILDEIKPEDAPHRKLITFVKDRPGHDYRYSLDYSKITDTLGWIPGADLNQQLKFTVYWFVENKNWLFNKYKYLQDLWSKVYSK